MKILIINGMQYILAMDERNVFADVLFTGAVLIITAIAISIFMTMAFFTFLFIKNAFKPEEN